MDGRAPDTIFDEGFQPRGTSTDLQDYAESNTPSNFISTSKTPAIAQNPDFAAPGKYLYEVDGQQVSGYDVNQALGSNSPFPNEQEIAVPGGIPTEAIINARPILSDGSLGEAIMNPKYGEQ